MCNVVETMIIKTTRQHTDGVTMTMYVLMFSIVVTTQRFFLPIKFKLLQFKLLINSRAEMSKLWHFRVQYTEQDRYTTGTRPAKPVRSKTDQETVVS